MPGDSLTLNFDIDGITIDDKGKVLYSIAYRGDERGRQDGRLPPAGSEPGNDTVFGGNRVQGFAHLDLGTEQARQYAMKVTVTDRASKASQELTHKFTV